MDKIRITSGIYRGRAIKSPELSGTHPMGAREKIALFNMLGDRIAGAMVLDVFSGSGALGIEALSRGAKEVVFIEKNRTACRTISDNLASLNESGELVCGDAYSLATQMAERFDIVIADPPYDKYDAGKIKALVSVVRLGGILALSHPGEAPEVPGLMLKKTRSYAGANISIYHYSER